ncbi:YihY/virulence factor BrkB family protein [Balneola sp. MJW-20]|uniref:YihY/virulence factor BrkB family protein n=1 Tax=Gracilimonas aurantiaca TaxID=3234185 RepID=UPI003465CA7B
MISRFIKQSWKIIQNSVLNFIDDNGFQFSAAVSFYSLFSLAPVIMIISYVLGAVLGDETVFRELMRYLETAVGSETAEAAGLLLDTVSTDSQRTIYLLVSIAILVVSSTTIFVQLKESFNQIFRVKSKEGVLFIKILIDRGVALLVIGLFGIALLLSLMIDSVMIYLFDFLLKDYESIQLILAGVVGNIFVLLTLFLLVLMMFYLLPDVKVGRKPLVIGSLITTLLLLAGKFIVGVIIGNSSLSQINGAASSIVVMLLWVYYSSIIIFYGAELIRAIASETEKGIEAGTYAEKYKLVKQKTEGNKRAK